MKVIISLILITFLVSFSIFGVPISFATKGAALPCCNSSNEDPRTTTYRGDYTYECYEGGVIVSKRITFDCCWDAWKFNNWQPPVYLNCPVGECQGPPDDFN